MTCFQHVSESGICYMHLVMFLLRERVFTFGKWQTSEAAHATIRSRMHSLSRRAELRLVNLENSRDSAGNILENVKVAKTCT